MSSPNYPSLYPSVTSAFQTKADQIRSSALASAPPPSAQQAPPAPSQELSRFDILVKNNELIPQVANQLWEVLSTCEIVLLCDDSASMNQPIAEEGTGAFAVKRSTRWLELQKLASIIINFVTAINQNGLDIYFLNRPKLTNVNNITGLQSVFDNPPHGGTPLIHAIKQICHDKNYLPNNKALLIVVITDGEPSDGSRYDLYNTLVQSTHKGNVHISFAECTDNEDDMEYLDQWDGRIKNFDNTDDYREELKRIKAVQGAQFKFNYTDYVIKILLATFVRWYFNLDQTRVNNQYNQQQAYQPPPAYSQVQNYQPPAVQYVQAYPATTQIYPATQQVKKVRTNNSNDDNGCCIIV